MKKNILLGFASILAFTLSFVSANAEEKMRTYKDKAGMSQSIAWWKDLALCSGTLAMVRNNIALKDTKRAKSLSDEINIITNWSIKRLMIDKDLSKEIAEDQIVSEAEFAMEMYGYDIEDIKDEKELLAYQENEISSCKKMINEYKQIFPKN